MNFKNLMPEYIPEESKEFKYLFTVFTPVYNCQDTISRVHDSLINQTCKDFEWLIINDGSTDATHDRIKSIQKNTPLNIRYIKNNINQHKMHCFMQAIPLAEGELFLTLDADDECVENALEIFEKEYTNIPNDLKVTIAAVTGICLDQYGALIGSRFPYQPFYSNTFKSNAIYKISGEKWGFTKTNVLRNLKYHNDFISNGFMPEGLIWNLLSKQGYTTKYINTPLRIYHTGLENSISSSGFEKTALGSATQYIANFNWFFNSYFIKAPIFFLKNLYFLLRISKYLDFNLKTYTTSIDSFVIKFFFVLLWPIRKFLK
ncbi:MAG: glycosyltransferase family 2 protein [Bacteroidia bacterium]|nr:glycosyltransferase family 2 protein [Bacteroidia bacterium]MBT8279468.1 glycosyltransferase family 2 protein [Bacteroidia bacterium]NND24946.1 glycosyltransferase family 2 protein [Flavobacteriaceae bacterium]NNK61293.1 glycosyltransferase family 2 protein [Flavobacteriaceae bacterium]NNL31736.1 glycosyltransferase family 2 protein [Flavobacteriaceae bacterium]